MSSRSNGSQGHSSRRDNPSISSTHSSGSGRNERGTRQANNPAVESAVTRLLVAIKQLLEALTLWSQLKIDETQVSDVYVRLGNDFNAAVAAFAAFGIDMSELMSVPDELRNVLEQCLAEDATVENLEIYLPTVREIITNLLQGLRTKQSIYRRIISDQRRASEQQPGSSGGGHERNESRSSRGERSARGHRSQLSRTIAEGERPERDSVSRRSAHSSSRRRDNHAQPPIPHNEEAFVGGFNPGLPEQFQPPSQSINEDSNPTFPESQARNPPHGYSPANATLPVEPYAEVPSEQPPDPPAETVSTLQSPPPSAVPAHVKRYSLVDKPASPPALVVVEPSSPHSDQYSGPSTPPPETLTQDLPPAVATSLAALKNHDALERRASKRFSSFNISKMTGASTTRERSRRGHPNRRSLAVSSALTPGELAVLTEVDDEDAPEPPPRDERSPRARSKPRAAAPERSQTALPAPPASPPKAQEHPTMVEDSEQQSSADTIAQPHVDTSRITVFLQLGREVKKASLEPNISFASLRVLFVDKFSYNPGQENFPAIYIRDPSSGVQYELENTDEVKEKCLLSLNIEPLDQIKQHIDSQISNLSKDIKDLRSAVSANNRQPTHIIAEPLAESTPIPNRPTDSQFQTVARRLSRFVGDLSTSSFTSQPPSSPSIGLMQPQMTGQSLQPQMSGGSILSDYTSRVVTDLKTQFDEVQNLRRDLGVMRQLYTEFMKQTKESLTTLRGQTQSVKQLASTNVGGARGYIDSGKKKLDIRSQTVLTDVEKLLDTVEGVKDDMTKRQTTPKEQYVKSIKKDLDSVANELESLKEHIKTIKPMWKKTWEEELQNIVEEQQFLTHQEGFLGDLLEDHKAAVEVYGHIEQIISLRSPGLNGSVKPRQGPRTRGFRPPPPEEGHNGLSSVMLEIRGAAVDPEQRMKAIEANQKNRQKERAARGDSELHAELTEFVGGKRLKMTGGADEAERVRQKRSEMTLKAMFSNSSTASSSPPTVNSDLP